MLLNTCTKMFDTYFEYICHVRKDIRSQKSLLPLMCITLDMVHKKNRCTSLCDKFNRTADHPYLLSHRLYRFLDVRFFLFLSCGSSLPLTPSAHGDVPLLSTAKLTTVLSIPLVTVYMYIKCLRLRPCNESSCCLRNTSACQLAMTQLPVVEYRFLLILIPVFSTHNSVILFRSHIREIENNLAASSVRSTCPLVISILWTDHTLVCHTTRECIPRAGVFRTGV